MSKENNRDNIIKLEVNRNNSDRAVQRDELHKTIWRIANDLRGSVTGWDFKSYVLGMLFYRFISENISAYIKSHQTEDDFNYATLADEEINEFHKDEMVRAKGFVMLPSQLFINVRKNAAKNDDLNATLDEIFKAIESSAVGQFSEKNFAGLFNDLDVNSNKLGATVEQRNKQLVKLMDAIGDLDLGDFQENTIDLFGDAYEYLLRMYASSAGKSGGEFFTPQEVSELLARLTVVGKTQVNKVYDPACGSGSLLLQFAKVLGKENVINGFYGQEINLTNYNLCRINMFLHDINFDEFDIAHGDTLINPNKDHAAEEPFEAIVSNPPYSIKWPGKNNPLLENDERFKPAGVLAPASKADLAFTMHILSWLAESGTAAIVEFPGVLYRGGAEQKIREYLVNNNYVDCVIQLPADLFFGTSIATCILILKKSKKQSDDKTSVLFIDASNEFVRSGNKNILSKVNIQNILDAYVKREDIPHFAKNIEFSAIRDKNYNIAVSSWVESKDTREVVDISALNNEIEQVVAKQMDLRTQINNIIQGLTYAC